MTSYLGPDNPPPLSLISENHQRSLQVCKVSTEDNSLFDLGEEYYSSLIKLLRLQAGIDIDDSICVVGSWRSKLPEQLERRLCLLKPVLHLTAGKILYENSPGKERDLNVSTLPVNAETYFSRDDIENTFDRIIIVDGLEMIDNRKTFLENLKSSLKLSSNSALIILHKTKDMLTLPVFLEVLDNFEKQQIEISVLLEQLMELNFLIGWNIVSLPIQIPKSKWFNQLFNFYPPIMEYIPTTNIYSGLRELVETKFKYSDFLVTIKDRFLLIVATNTDLYLGQQPYKMYFADDDLVYSSSLVSQPITDSLLRLKITPDIRSMLPKNLESMEKFMDSVNTYPEEWWGTIPKASLGTLDKSRINHNIK